MLAMLRAHVSMALLALVAVLGILHVVLIWEMSPAWLACAKA